MYEGRLIRSNPQAMEALDALDEALKNFVHVLKDVSASLVAAYHAFMEEEKRKISYRILAFVNKTAQNLGLKAATEKQARQSLAQIQTNPSKRTASPANSSMAPAGGLKSFLDKGAMQAAASTIAANQQIDPDTGITNGASKSKAHSSSRN